LDRCTTEIKAYPIDLEFKYDKKTIFFYDTPGVEKWTEKDFESFMEKIMIKTKPICVLVCIAPGNFAVTEQLTSFIGNIISKGIWVSLIMTNMMNGNNDQKKKK